MKINIYVILLILLTSLLWADEISNFRFEQRTDGSLKVDIYYDLAYEDYAQYAKIVVEASDDDGETWDLKCSSMTGDIGSVTAGDDKQIVWDFYTDNPNVSGDDYKIKLTCYLYSTMTGNDSTVYTTIKLGDQWWMAENLRETQYRDGTSIEYISDADSSIAGRCAYDNNENNANVYGYLYNGYAASDSKISPSGWHVPSDEDFQELEMYLGMSASDAASLYTRGTNEGSKLAGNRSLWQQYTIEDNDEFGVSGFMGLPSGYRLWYNKKGYYLRLGTNLSLWTTRTKGWSRLVIRKLYGSSVSITRDITSKYEAISIRLVKD